MHSIKERRPNCIFETFDFLLKIPMNLLLQAVSLVNEALLPLNIQSYGCVRRRELPLGGPSQEGSAPPAESVVLRPLKLVALSTTL